MSNWSDAVHEGLGGLTIDVEVVPNAASPGFPVGYNRWRKRLQARVGARAEAGRANEELVSIVAEVLRVAPRDVEILEGVTSRRKRLLVRTADPGALRRRIEESTLGR